MAKIKVGFLFDKTNNWIFEDVKNYNNEINKKKYSTKYSYNPIVFKDFEIVFIINYTKIISDKLLNKIKLPVVVHASDLPKGKGFAPLIWQILEGKNHINISMIKAVKQFDSGPIIFKEKLKLNGHELYKELRSKLAKIILKLIKKLLLDYPKIKYNQQNGKSTFYRRRYPKDSRLNINKNIKSQFNLLRTCDNEKWPAYFNYKNKKYIIKIYESKI